MPVARIKLSAGFSIAVDASGVANARQMALSEKGTVFVGSRNAGRVHALVDKDGDAKVDQVHTIATGLRCPAALRFAAAPFTSRKSTA